MPLTGYSMGPCKFADLNVPTHQVKSLETGVVVALCTSQEDANRIGNALYAADRGVVATADPDEVEAKRLADEVWWGKGDKNAVSLAKRALQRGRELERGEPVGEG